MAEVEESGKVSNLLPISNKRKDLSKQQNVLNNLMWETWLFGLLRMNKVQHMP